MCLSLQAWCLARHKSPSLQPYGSHYHSFSKVCWPLRGPLTLHYASFSISFSLTVSVVLSPGLILSLAVCPCYSVSVSLPLSCLPSQCLLATIVSPSDCTPLSLSLSHFLSSHLPPPPSLPLSLHGSPAHLPKPLLASRVPNL